MGSPIRVAALTQGRNAPSARFRVRQFISALSERGIEVQEYAPAATPLQPFIARARRAGFSRASVPAQWLETVLGRAPGLWATRKADVLWLSKQLVPGVPTLEHLLRRPCVLDVDDAMWLARPFGRAAAASAARQADIVVTGNAYLAQYYAKYNASVRVIPTSIDVARFVPRTWAPKQQDFVIGWTGSRTNLPFVEQLDGVFSEFMRQHREARLLVMCDVPPRFRTLPPDRVTFVPWSADLETKILHSMSVGIMPLPDTPLTRGKCSFKMLQYMSSGLPVIVSPVGSNAEILALSDIGWGAADDDSWLHALNACFASEELARAKGLRGRQVVIDHYALESAADKLAVVFRELA